MRAAIPLILGLAISRCGIGGCPDDLQWRVSPRSVVLEVGESVTIEVEALGCGGTEPLAVDMRWVSSDNAVASVDVVTGRVLAVAAGEATVTGEDRGPYGQVFVPVRVVESR